MWMGLNCKLNLSPKTRARVVLKSTPGPELQTLKENQILPFQDFTIMIMILTIFNRKFSNPEVCREF
jgi:hypothetical protein